MAATFVIAMCARQALSLTQNETDFPQGYDAVTAAPGSHRVIFENTIVRVLEVTMPPPGDIAPARIEKHISDPIWDTLYAPVAGAVWHLSLLLNHLQFLTIRRYLGFVFAALVILLLVLALWQ